MKTIVIYNTGKKFDRVDNAHGKYLNEIRRYKTMTKEEEAEEFMKFHSGDNSAKERIIKANLKLAMSVALQFAKDNNVMDCIGEANLGLLEAVEKFDENYENKFASFAIWYIRLRVSKFVRSKDKLVTSNKEFLHAGKANRIKSAFLQENEREITDDELIEELEKEGVCVKDASIFSVKTKSISKELDDEFTYEDSEEFASYSASHNEYEDVMESDDVSYRIFKLMKKLTPIEKVAIEYAYGLNGKTQMEFDDMSKVLGVCAERCRQIVRGAEQKMRG